MITMDGHIATTLGKKIKVPSVCYTVGDDIHIHAHQNSFLKKHINTTLQRSSLIFAVSFSIKKRIMALFPNIPSEKIEVIYRGIDLTQLKFYPKREIRIQLDLPQENHLVLYVGALSSDKGTFDLIKTAQHFNDHPVNFVLVGGDTTNPEMTEKSKNIIFIGRKKFDDVMKYYSACDLFLFPSHREGLPNVLIEAGAYRLPCLVSNIEANREIIDHHESGDFFEVGDVSKMVTLIEEFLSAKDRFAEYGENHRKKVEAVFNAQANVNKMITHFYKLIEDNK